MLVYLLVIDIERDAKHLVEDFFFELRFKSKKFVYFVSYALNIISL